MLSKYLTLFTFYFIMTYCFSYSKENPKYVKHMSRLNDNADNGSQGFKTEKQSVVNFAFAKQFQDNMVLQRAPKRAKIYGFSPDIGAKVIAQLILSSEDQNYYGTNVVPGPEPGVGKWEILLDPVNITDPVSIKVISESRTLSLKNVLFGDVWLCSGQSNMQFTVSQMFNGDQEAFDAHNYPNIRLFTVQEVQSDTPLYDLEGIAQNWAVPSKESLSSGAWKYFSAVCWLYGKHLFQSLGYPIGLVATDWGGTPVEAWSSPDALKTCNVTDTQVERELKISGEHFDQNDLVNGPKKNSILWNAMVNPLVDMTIYGAIWYQGEDDADFPYKLNRYNCTFPAMIADWRHKFNKASKGQTSELFPFGFVQLSAYRPGSNITYGFPDIRWHQTADYGFVPNPKMPNTFMAVTMDLPDFESSYGSIHPRDKEDVGFRLAVAGRAIAYKMPEVFQGPLPHKGVFLSSRLMLDYGKGWTLKVMNAKGFELSCQSEYTIQLPTWYSVPIMAYSTSSVTLDARVCKGKSPHAIRYAWRESPCAFKDCAIYSTINSLPGPPFMAYFKTTTDGSHIFQL